MTDQLIAAVERRRTFSTLDALRGVAAIAVVAFHYPELLAPIGFGDAYLAVDLFFLMSGVVIAHAYRARFDAGLRPAAFLLARVVRLYPLFAIGVLLSIGTVAAGLMAGLPSRWTWTGLATALPNLFFLPAPPIAGRSPELYPLNFPAWSLLYELLVNFALALGWRWLRGGRLALILAIAAVSVVVVAIAAGQLDGGLYYGDVATGVARVTFSFFLGVAMVRMTGSAAVGRLPAVRVPVPVILAVATVLLLLPVPSAWRAGYDVLCVILLFPLLVWAAIHSEPQRGVALCALLGLISYPLYTLHIPSKLLVIGAARTLSGGDPSLLAPGIGLAAIAGLIAASWITARYLDPPLRRTMERALRMRRSPDRREPVSHPARHRST